MSLMSFCCFLFADVQYGKGTLEDPAKPSRYFGHLYPHGHEVHGWQHPEKMVNGNLICDLFS